MQKLVSKYLYSILFLIILAVGIFLRFYNTPARYGLDPDAARDAIITTYGAQTFQFPATGPISALGSFTFGPYYYYQLILFRIIAPLAYAPWIYMGIISLIVIFIFYKIGKLLEGEWFGLILVGWVAVAPSQIAPATGLSNPNLVTLFSSLAILLFIYILKKDPAWWWALILGIDIGLGINMHYQMIFYLIIPFLLLFSDKKKRISYFIASLLGIALAFIPLALFDLTHSFINTQGLLNVLHGSGINKVPNSWKIYLGEFWPKFLPYVFGVQQYVGLTIFILAVATNIFLFAKKKLSKEYILLIVAFFVMFLGLRFYSGERVVYYLFFIEPFIFIFAAMLFYLPFKLNLKKLQYVGIITAFLLFGFIVVTTLPNYHTYDTRIDTLRRVNDILKKYPNNKFAIYSCRNVEDYKAQGVVFILGSMNKLDNKGKKIGMIITDCSQNMNIDTPLIDKEVTDLSGKSNRTLKVASWTMITPGDVFHHYADWYIK